jgi:hypothetical protein
MKISVWKVFTVFGIVSTWFAEVHEKGEITVGDAKNLIVCILSATGSRLSIKL